ncbi:envelope glycoprotein L [Macropodid alphaherpesvirus 4]|uniref:Envelope glycoprotein L n=1 Tax=Macropodid alphaherpesvirus 4 TaxID=2762721 RepID=A0A7L7YUF4_9ALPH|nr:envelope glycoprotein L [Macropodid alphaherpesvirus 4]QOD40175.1 envelope glycoprotein L [Macropodid alphaherpesvirus 4]
MGRICGQYWLIIFVGVLLNTTHILATEYVVRSIHASKVGDILAFPCLQHPPPEVSWQFEVPPTIDYTKLDGVIIRYHCPLFDTILWDKTAQRAYWVNPVVFIDGFVRDLRHNNLFRQHEVTSAYGQLYLTLSNLRDPRSPPLGLHAVENGCVPYDYSRTRDCTGTQQKPSPTGSRKINPEDPVAPTPDLVTDSQ